MILIVAAIITISLSQVNGDPLRQNNAIDVLKKTRVIEGDILVDVEQQQSLQDGLLGNVLKSTSRKRWRKKSGVVKVPYVLSRKYSAKERSVITASLSKLSDLTGNCVRFVPRTTQRDYVHVYKTKGCYSYVGRIGGVQKLHLGRGCVRQGIVQHEFLHALGFWHEHNRADRDKYVTIKWENIKPQFRYAFNKRSWQHTSVYGQPYDYSSVMHYHGKAFSINGKATIVSKDPSIKHLGQYNGATKIDIAKLKALYRC